MPSLLVSGSRGLTGVVHFAAILVACHRPARVAENNAPRELFRDTTVGVIHYTGAATFDLQRERMRDTLRGIVNAQRKLWRAAAPIAHRFLLRVQCFCPGQRGWVLIEAREGKPLGAWSATGEPIKLTDWSVLSIDALYDNLQRSVERDASVQVAFDSRWHFPAYLSTTASARLPDTWSIVEVRGFRPF